MFPSVLKLAFGMGKDYGRGAMVCRTGKEFNGPWGAPAMYALEGDSLGMQIGGESTDLILLVMNEKGAASILSSKIMLGGDASAAAGPKGRDASADTDLWMKAEILSYSRSRGLFAGISLEGSTLRPDNKANQRIYGRKITARAILLENKVSVPKTGRHLVHVLQANAPRNESKQVALKVVPLSGFVWLAGICGNGRGVRVHCKKVRYHAVKKDLARGNKPNGPPREPIPIGPRERDLQGPQRQVAGKPRPPCPR